MPKRIAFITFRTPHIAFFNTPSASKSVLKKESAANSHSPHFHEVTFSIKL